MVYLLARERSERMERDTYRGNTIENRGCLFSEASEADSLMSSRYIYILFRSRNCFCSCVGVSVYPFSYALARAG